MAKAIVVLLESKSHWCVGAAGALLQPLEFTCRAFLAFSHIAYLILYDYLFPSLASCVFHTLSSLIESHIFLLIQNSISFCSSFLSIFLSVTIVWQIFCWTRICFLCQLLIWSSGPCAFPLIDLEISWQVPTTSRHIASRCYLVCPTCSFSACSKRISFLLVTPLALSLTKSCPCI